MEKVNNFLKRKKMYIAAFLLLSSNAMAATADAPWISGLDKLMKILTGPTARIISILALALLGFAIMAGLTENLSKRATFFNKEVLDHIIVGKEGVYKYSENDLIFMDEVKKAKEYLETHKTYNCLTGEPINIQTHSSGENKWIGKKDVERYGIEKLEGAKETIGKITYIENNKLYQKPVSYYNLSDLKITKEIEQKFVPMKEKEQKVEKNIDKEIER